MQERLGSLVNTSEHVLFYPLDTVNPLQLIMKRLAAETSRSPVPAAFESRIPWVLFMGQGQVRLNGAFASRYSNTSKCRSCGSHPFLARIAG